MASLTGLFALDFDVGFLCAALLDSFFLVLLVSDFLALLTSSLIGDCSYFASSLLGVLVYFTSSLTGLAGDSSRFTSSLTGLFDCSFGADLLG